MELRWWLLVEQSRPTCRREGREGSSTEVEAVVVAVVRTHGGDPQGFGKAKLASKQADAQPSIHFPLGGVNTHRETDSH